MHNPFPKALSGSLKNILGNDQKAYPKHSKKEVNRELYFKFPNYQYTNTSNILELNNRLPCNSK